MINRQQLERLTVVLTIPFLLLGVWLAEHEVIFNTNYIIDCEELDTHFSCIGRGSTHNAKNRHFYDLGGIHVDSARLTNGLNHPIVTLGRNRGGYKDGTQQTYIIGAGISKNLIIDRNIGASYNYIGNGPCRLSPYAGRESPYSGDDGNWLISCIGELPDTFTFENPTTARKFREMLNEVEQLEREFNGYKIRSYVVQVIFPFLAYLFLLMASILTSKVIRYVIHGKF